MIREPPLSYSDVLVGSRWRHRKTGRVVLVASRSYDRGIVYRYDDRMARRRELRHAVARFLELFTFEGA